MIFEKVKYNQIVKVILKVGGFILICVGSFMSAFAQTTQFSVDMSYFPLGIEDKVVVRGNIEELGMWTSAGELELTKTDNSNIYSAIIELPEQIKSVILYKYVIIRGNGKDEWEQRGNRTLKRGNTKTVWFDDRTSSGVQQTFVNVTFRLDLSNHAMDGAPAEDVALLGLHSPLSFDLESGRREMVQVSEGIWETSIAFPFGTPLDVPFKFAWKYNDEWKWEWRAGHTNHVLLIDDSKKEQLVELKYNVNKPGIVATSRSAGFVDNYEIIIKRLGDAGLASRYVYELAMEQLTNGKMEEGLGTYNQYKQAHPGGEEIDDFYYQMTYELEKTQGYDAATNFITEKKSSETIPERRAYYEYLQGELLMNVGQNVKAREIFAKVIAKTEWDVASEYSKKAMIQSYLNENEPDSIRLGIQLLRRDAMSASKSEQRYIYTQLERGYRRAKMDDRREQVLQKLASTGSESEQSKWKINLARSYMRTDKLPDALSLIESIEPERIPKWLQMERKQMQIELYLQLDMTDKVTDSIDDYKAQWPDGPYLRRIGKIKEEIQKKKTSAKMRQN